jgi:hypothetical protein
MSEKCWFWLNAALAPINLACTVAHALRGNWWFMSLCLFGFVWCVLVAYAISVKYHHPERFE